MGSVGFILNCNSLRRGHLENSEETSLMSKKVKSFQSNTFTVQPSKKCTIVWKMLKLHSLIHFQAYSKLPGINCRGLCCIPIFHIICSLDCAIHRFYINCDVFRVDKIENNVFLSRSNRYSNIPWGNAKRWGFVQETLSPRKSFPSGDDKKAGEAWDCRENSRGVEYGG